MNLGQWLAKQPGGGKGKRKASDKSRARTVEQRDFDELSKQQRDAKGRGEEYRNVRRFK